MTLFKTLPLFWCCLLVGLACAGLSGCSRVDQPTAATRKRLEVLSLAYADYLVATGKSPAGEDQLRAHFANLPPFIAEEVAGNGLENALLSARDGEPFVICFGLTAADLVAPQRVVAFERTGQGGKRLVANLDGAIESLDEATCKERGLLP
jgi:hypothetical protein